MIFETLLYFPKKPDIHKHHLLLIFLKYFVSLFHLLNINSVFFTLPQFSTLLRFNYNYFLVFCIKVTFFVAKFILDFLGEFYPNAERKIIIR